MLNERRRIVLAALVEEYVASAQPVASKSLVDRYQLGCSPATVRNDLAALEETGLRLPAARLGGPHPDRHGLPRVRRRPRRSAARAVTLSAEEVEAIHSCYAHVEQPAVRPHARDVGDALASSRATSPSCSRPCSNARASGASTSCRLAPRRALLVVITEAGRVANRQVEFDDDTAEEDVREAERYLNATFDGKLAEELPTRRARGSAASRGRPSCRRCSARCSTACARRTRSSSTAAAPPTLLEQPEFADSRVVRPLLALLEDGYAMLRVLDDAMESSDVVVRIGHENSTRGPRSR